MSSRGLLKVAGPIHFHNLPAVYCLEPHKRVGENAGAARTVFFFCSRPQTSVNFLANYNFHVFPPIGVRIFSCCAVVRDVSFWRYLAIWPQQYSAPIGSKRPWIYPWSFFVNRQVSILYITWRLFFRSSLFHLHAVTSGGKTVLLLQSSSSHLAQLLQLSHLQIDKKGVDSSFLKSIRSIRIT